MALPNRWSSSREMICATAYSISQGKKGSNQRIIFWFTKWHFMLVFQHSGLQKSTELGENAIVLSRRWSRYNLWCWSTASWGYGRRYYISIAPIICTGILWLKYLESISIVSELRGVKIWNFDTSHHTWRPSKNPKKNLVLVAECVTWFGKWWNLWVV